jgi:hypothetical protein
VIVSRSESGLSASARLLAEHLSAQSDWGPELQPATPGSTELP